MNSPHPYEAETTSPVPPPASASRARRLGEVAALFLRFGATAFGGPAAHVALLEDEVVRRRRWVTHEEFLDLLGAVNLIPGPNSTEMAIHLGYRRAGWPGLIVGGVAFILPAMLLVTAIAWLYVRLGSLPQLEGLLYGVKPVVIAVVLQALWGLGRKALKTPLLSVVALGAAVAGFLGVDVLLAILAAGVVTGTGRAATQSGGPRVRPVVVLLLVAAIILGFAYLAARPTAAEGTAPGVGPLFVYFLKVGAVLYGTGYVLLAYLQTDLVTNLQWVSAAQLLDATAVGQVTPGPLFTTATFIGFLVARWPGALMATIGIFLPSFVFVALSGPLLPRLRKSPVAAAFLDGVNAASLALMAVVTWELGRAAIISPLTVAVALVSAVLLVRYRINSAWLLLGGAVLGLAAQALAGP